VIQQPTTLRTINLIVITFWEVTQPNRTIETLGATPPA
jgi:hypothetical protein